MSARDKQKERDSTVPVTPKKIAIACQGGGTHAAFEAGVLVEILKDIQEQKQSGEERFRLIGVSGTSAGALNALMVWYGLATKAGKPGSEAEAIERLKRLWDQFAAIGIAENLVNFASYSAFKAGEAEIPVLGLNAPLLSLDPRGAISQTIIAALPLLGVRRKYFDLEDFLDDACPQFDDIDWQQVGTRLLVGATEIINGIETVFDSNRKLPPDQQRILSEGVKVAEELWRQRRPLSLKGVAASGTLPEFRSAQRIDGRYYWDGLYSLNPPIREFWQGLLPEYVPDEIWVVRINPQQCAQEPRSHAEIEDRENELMGNLSLNKELDFILHMNLLIEQRLLTNQKQVKVRTIKMTEKSAELPLSSKFNRSRDLINRMRKEGGEIARRWLNDWPDRTGFYPEDAGYWPPPQRDC